GHSSGAAASVSREDRISGRTPRESTAFARLTSKRTFSVEDFKALQHDSTAWKAEQLVPLLRGVRGDSTVERARQLPINWDRNLSKDSGAATLYVLWEQKLEGELAAGKVPEPMASDYTDYTDYTGRTGQLLVPKYLSPDAEWFGPSSSAARDKALAAALAAAVNDLTKKASEDSNKWGWGTIYSATFRHVLGGDAELQQRLNVGPFPRAGCGNTPFATGGRGFEQNNGASNREILDVADWDRSMATSAPGQSGQPGSPHFDDLAKLWVAQTYFSLSFRESAVKANAEATLTLTPAQVTQRQ
ncbi:MAG: penicillin acylase family protein, partial [Thermoanaerobaculia bacterium]